MYQVTNTVATILIATAISGMAIAEPGNEIDMPDMHESAGLMLPEGFSATVYHDGVGKARHIAVRENGDVFVALSDNKNGGGSVALRDTNGDSRADKTEYFGSMTGTGVAISGNWLYRSSKVAVYRYRLGETLAPTGDPEIIVDGFPKQRSHAAKSLALDTQGHLYVNSGAPSNACQRESRQPESPGLKPCPHLERSGGIWRVSADKTDQSQLENGEKYVTGIRNAVAIAIGPQDTLFFVQHGRDQLDTLWPKYFSVQQRIELPAEEFHRAVQGADYGWPYTYYDPMRGERMIGPEYGGDGKTVAEKGKYQEPLAVFPAHWAPNSIVFYTGSEFPERYHGGAFVAFHGSWNRAPNPQEGFRVVFVPFDGSNTDGSWITFADGFKGGDETYRPTGLAVGPEGSLYISETEQGRIWKVSYTGN